MLHYNPNKRPTIEQVFNHPWMQEKCPESEKVAFLELQAKLPLLQNDAQFELKP